MTDQEALRALVRETLVELLPDLRSQNGHAPVQVEPLRIERGALTEKLVMSAAKDGRRVVLGRRAVATPLALDKARSLGVDVERTD